MDESYRSDRFQEQLEKVLEDFEFRDSQKEMMEEIKTAFDTSSHVMVEAGTGTGKSLAYLYPGVEYTLKDDKPLVISTATIALQEQLINKEIFVINKLFQEEIRAVVLKGRSNFLCMDKYYEKYGQDVLVEIPGREKLKEWVNQTSTGDWQEIEGYISREMWEEVASSSESCLGYKCLYYNDCFVTKQKREGANAHIIITNHHLFFSDLKLRIDTDGSQGILPDYNCIIFDEAHHLEERALLAFGVQVRRSSLIFWLGEAKRILESAEDFDVNIVNRLERQIHKCFEELEAENDKSYLLEEWKLPAGFSDITRGLVKLSHHVEEFLDRDYINPDKIEILANNLRKIKENIDFISSPSGDEYVSWVEVNNKRKNHALCANPLEVSEHLQKYLYESTDCCVFTSATLAINGDFVYMKNKLGLIDCRGAVISSPFDYERQSYIFVPLDIPVPGGENYEKELVKGIKTLIELNEGSALVLFTSYRMMDYVYRELEGEIDYLLLKQGDMGKKNLLEWFKEDKHSVLLATDSFREGIDVRGDALSLLIMDKLPFSVPRDPLIKARINYIEKKGINSFAFYMLPEAVLKLKQGFGRLIRHRNDKGIIAVFDSRIHRMSYGSRFLNSLPPSPLLKTWEELYNFFG